MRILALLTAMLATLSAVSATTYYCPVTGRYFDDSTAPGRHCPNFVDKNGDGYCDNLKVVSSNETSSESAKTTSTSTSEQHTASTTGTSTGTTSTPVGIAAVIAGLVIAAVLLRRL